MVRLLFGMILFSLVHSITADAQMKERISNTIGLRAYYGGYRIVYNLISAITIMPILIYMGTIHYEMYRVPDFMATIFIGIQILGVLGAVIALAQIDFWRFIGLRQALAYIRGDDLPLPEEGLQTNGLYSVVRHPLYFFSILAIWFSPTMTYTGFIFNICVTLYFIIGSRIEERRMVANFGNIYEEYQKQVDWIFPIQYIQFQWKQKLVGK